MIAAATDTPASSPWIVAIVASLATFMEVLDTTIVNVSLSHIAGTLGAGQDESTWVLTSYLVANAIILPLSGWLSDVVGRKKYFMLCVVGFTLSSFFCGSANSLMMLVVFRLLQGLSGGGLQPTQQAIILDAFPPEKRGVAFGLVGITMIAAPILGPTLGGWITDNFSWRWVFFINVPVGIMAIMLIKLIIPETPKVDAPAAGQKRKIDYIGLSLVALAVGALQIMLDKGQQDDWFDSAFIVKCALVSAASFLGAVFWLLRQKTPVVELRLFKDRAFALSCITIFVTGFSLYGSSILLPILVQSQFGYDSTLAGLVISPGGFVVMFLMPVMGRLTGLIQARYLVMIGLSLLAIGMWHSSQITPQLNYGHFVWMRITQVLGLPFLFIPISTLAFMNVPKHLNNKASALYALCRNMGGSVGIAVAATLVARYQQVNQSALVRNMSMYDPNFREIVRGMTQKLGDQATAMGVLYRELLRQATILSFVHVYQIMTAMAVATALMLFFMPRNNPRAPMKAPDAAH